MAKGYLYVIKDNQTMLTKIGITGNWRSRLKTLKVGSRTECKIVVEVDSNREWEKRLHKKYDFWRLVGTEWFKLNLELEQDLIYSVERIGIPVTLSKKDSRESSGPKKAKERETYLINAVKERNEATAKAFCLARMQMLIEQEWKRKGLDVTPDNPPFFFNAKIKAEAERRYANGFRHCSTGKWAKVNTDGKWIDCTEDEASI